MVSDKWPSLKTLFSTSYVLLFNGRDTERGNSEMGHETPSLVQLTPKTIDCRSSSQCNVRSYKKKIRAI